MNKSDKTNRNISFVSFIFSLFSTSLDLRSSPGENIFKKRKHFTKFLKKFSKELICYKRNEKKGIGDVANPFVE